MARLVITHRHGRIAACLVALLCSLAVLAYLVTASSDPTRALLHRLDALIDEHVELLQVDGDNDDKDNKDNEHCLRVLRALAERLADEADYFVACGFVVAIALVVVVVSARGLWYVTAVEGRDRTVAFLTASGEAVLSPSSHRRHHHHHHHYRPDQDRAWCTLSLPSFAWSSSSSSTAGGDDDDTDKSGMSSSPPAAATRPRVNRLLAPPSPSTPSSSTPSSSASP